ncbi:hypothetical protein AB0J43_05470 [Nonomuraea fuscirosea]
MSVVNPTISRDDILRVSVQVTHRFTREQLVNALARWATVQGVETLQPEMPQRATMDLVRRLARSEGTSAGDPVGPDQVAELEWAERQVARVWLAGGA